ncbi:TfoX/Sxy family DNA transformation protein [Pectinatus frisingensis]|uniref:TfoX/Sxy family DNA transformation protein n=1 Tax=Pectinatus frisingensis TaxID=865 RepID=UPI0018C5E2CD|nr:TfoX/Sxy family DNA transformation protein [Pectinatus frisingensis]
MSELSKLPNVGKVLEENLLAVGIETPEQLREIGVEEAFRRIRIERGSRCLLAHAVRDTGRNPWHSG